MSEKSKYTGTESLRKSSFIISVIAHAVLLLIFNFAALYIFKHPAKTIVYLELDSREIPPELPDEDEEPFAAPSETKQLPPVNLPEVTSKDESKDAVTDSLLYGKKDITSEKGTAKNGIPDSIKSLAELKILIAQDIKKNYGKTDYDRIRKMWRRYMEQNPYGPTYDGYLGDNPGMSIPIDDILNLFNGENEESKEQDADGIE